MCTVFGLAAGIVAAVRQYGWQDRAVTIAVLFIPSLVFGWAYERSENIVVPSLAHGLYNSTLFGLLYIAVTMGDTEAALLLP